MIKAPKDGAGTGGASGIVLLVNQLVHNPALNHYVLTDAQGRFTALLCRETGMVFRLSNRVQA